MLAARLVGRRFVAYSAEFAKRFSLEPQKPDPQLDEGLQAVEIGVEVQPGIDVVGCYVALYLASSMVPSENLGEEASANVLEPSRHFFLRPRKDGTDPRQLIGNDDASHLLSRQARYFEQLVFSTSDYSTGWKRGARTSIAIAEEVEQLFPGINYIRSRGCMSALMISHGAGVDIGIRRKGAPNYPRLMGPLRDEDFIRIPLPRTLLDMALPTLKAYDEYILEVSNEQARRRRDAAEKAKHSR
jgi:hypothetical protein